MKKLLYLTWRSQNQKGKACNFVIKNYGATNCQIRRQNSGRFGML